MSRKIGLILGACSGIAQAICRELAGSGHALVLVARDPQGLQAIRDDLVARGCEVLQTHCVDFLDFPAMERMFADVGASGPLDLALVAHGVMHANDECARDSEKFRVMVETNFTSAAFCAERSLRLFDARRGGELVVISSVAGDRGRAKNYFYGASKAGLDAFVAGLRLASAGSAVNIMTLKPGPVDTAMSAGVRKGPLWASATQVARVLCGSLGKRRHTVYAPRYWRAIMWVVRNLPAALLARLPI